MATSRAYDVENERMNPDGGGGVAGRDIKRRTPLIMTPVNLDTEIPVARSGAHGSNQNSSQIGASMSRKSAVAGDYNSKSSYKPATKRNP